ncbi:MAG: NADH-quinone oxidoreductase subunit D [Phycisphaerales bacterium]|nr:NADH-quinone oxidoreductase subunit D [Phycisphaerales bacterium]
MSVSYDLGKPTTLTREAGSEDRWTLNFGPQHPATHTTLRLVMELEGERIVSVIPDIGFLHSGFEKLGEHLNYNQYVVVVERMNYVCPISNDIAWHMAVEKLFGLELTPRCKAIRTILCELGRLQDHFLNVGVSGLDLGGLTAFLYGFNEREFLYDLIEEVSGSRFHPSYTRVGGLAQDIPTGWPGRVRKFLRTRVPTALKDIEALLLRNRIFIERTKGIGMISHDDAVNWSLTGPVARASGVKRDVRKDEPYLCYADNWDGRGAPAVDFQVPIAYGGDVYARFMIRMEEIRQSCRILEQLLDRIPEGPINALPAQKMTLPDKREIYFSIEGLIHHFEKVMTNRGLEPPLGEAYAANETANGELGYYVVSDGTNVPWRARTRPPSFINYQVFPHMIVGHQISDVPAVLNSLNIIAAELDR